LSTFFQLTDLGLTVSPQALLQQWLTYMQSIFPGYTPSAGNLEYIQAVIFAAWASDVAYQASQGANDLFRQYGMNLVGVQPLQGTSSQAQVTLATTDAAGYTLPAGTQFLLDNTFGFVTSLDQAVPSGQTSVTFPIFSITPGSEPNGAGAQSVVVNQQIDWVSSVSLVAPAAGGIDAETADQYQVRLAAQLQLMAPRPITASDYAAFVLDFQPAVETDQQEVGRATAVDGYDPQFPVGPGWSSMAGGTGTYGNEREVTVAVTDVNGVALNSDTLSAIQSWIAGFREVNFIVNVVSPTYTPVYVTCSVFRDTAFTVQAVQQNIQTALLNLLSPATWPGNNPYPSPSSTGVGTLWSNTPTINIGKILATITQSAGVLFVETGTLAIGFSPGPTGTADLVMPGPFPLPITTAAQLPLTAFTVLN